MFDYTKDTGQLGFENKPLTPHPDGKAWPKCCRNNNGLDCAFIKNQKSGARLSVHRGSHPVLYGEDNVFHTPKDVPFMCAHRSTDDGFYRVCAGWDACFGNKSKP